MKCPKCNSDVPAFNINIQTDIAKCDNCSHVFKLSEAIETVDTTFDINNTVSGTWYIRNMDNIVIGGTTRSAIAFFLVPFMLIWSGGSLGGIYGTQIASGEFSLFQSLFGIPFLLGSVLFWSIAIMAIWGKVELKIDKYGGTIFTGVGIIGIKQKFVWNDIANIREKDYANSRRNYGSHIAMEGKNIITFGSGLSEERKYYLLKSLQKIQAEIKKNGYLY